jgi:hypothetical protein
LNHVRRSYLSAAHTPNIHLFMYPDIVQQSTLTAFLAAEASVYIMLLYCTLEFEYNYSFLFASAVELLSEGGKDSLHEPSAKGLCR